MKIKLLISKLYGIQAREGGTEYAYPIKGKRFNIIQSLKDGRKLGGIIESMQKRSLSVITKEIGLINKQFKKTFKKLRIKDNIIVHVATGGYDLNHEKFDITFSD